MKELLKSKFLWSGIACLVISILFAVFSLTLTPNNKLASKMGNAICNKNQKAFISCYSEDDREEAGYEFKFYYLDETLDAVFGDSTEKPHKNKRYFLQGEEFVNNDGTIEVPAKLVTISGDEVSDISSLYITIYEENGKQYIK